MIKMVVGLFGFFVVAGNADIDPNFPIISIGIGIFLSSVFFLKGLHEMIGLQTERY